ncbi:MAG: hypothetical protein IKW60_05655 [Clostridia bacterium]|nr:hypothetical protein [Clostridia bacterium]
MGDIKRFSLNGLSSNFDFAMEIDRRVASVLKRIENKGLSTEVIYNVADKDCLAIHIVAKSSKESDEIVKKNIDIRFIVEVDTITSELLESVKEEGLVGNAGYSIFDKNTFVLYLFVGNPYEGVV